MILGSPLAVNVVEVPEQISGEVALTLIVGGVFTVATTATRFADVQPVAVFLT